MSWCSVFPQQIISLSHAGQSPFYEKNKQTKKKKTYWERLISVLPHFRVLLQIFGMFTENARISASWRATQAQWWTCALRRMASELKTWKKKSCGECWSGKLSSCGRKCVLLSHLFLYFVFLVSFSSLPVYLLCVVHPLSVFPLIWISSTMHTTQSCVSCANSL